MTPSPAAATATDDELRAVLADAHLPSLLATLAVLVGDPALLPEHLRPDTTAIIDPDAGLTADDLAEARELAFAALVRWRDGGCPAGEPPPESALLDAIGFVVGDAALAARHQTFFAEELGLDGIDPREPDWTKADLAPDRPFTVAVIGAGMSGLAAAHRLTQAGIDHVVLEKNDDVGGTWLENTYPGCRVDVPSHLYSFSFAQRADWPELFSRQPVLLDYFRSVAEELGLRPSIRFGTTVESATFDEGERRWHVAVTGPDGPDELVVDAVISAVGQLNRPTLPTVPGIERFAGPAFHSAQWDHSVDLTGLRVGVIGTGASALQFVPEIAEQAAELVVVQRTPNWIVSTDDYRAETPPGLRWLMDHVPGYAQWYRLWLFWRTADGLLPAARVDPEWDGDPRSVSEMNDQVRQLLGAMMQMELTTEPELAPLVIPQYAPAGKRIVRDNGRWFATLQQPHVHLVTGEVSEVTEKGIVVDGEEHAVDVLIYATGFAASRFLTPMKVVGRGGVDLHEQWDGDARAYMGMTVPDFPNLFLLYGPNTNIVLNGSIVFFSECEVHYVLSCLRLLLAEDLAGLDCKQDVHDAYNERIDAGNTLMAWGAADVNSWYRNAKGRVSQNWPFTLLEFWEQTAAVDPADYEALPRRT